MRAELARLEQFSLTLQTKHAEQMILAEKRLERDSVAWATRLRQTEEEATSLQEVTESRWRLHSEELLAERAEAEAGLAAADLIVAKARRRASRWEQDARRAAAEENATIAREERAVAEASVLEAALQAQAVALQRSEEEWAWLERSKEDRDAKDARVQALARRGAAERELQKSTGARGWATTQERVEAARMREAAERSEWALRLRTVAETHTEQIQEASLEAGLQRQEAANLRLEAMTATLQLQQLESVLSVTEVTLEATRGDLSNMRGQPNE